MIKTMKVAVVYVWPAGGAHYDQNAQRFCDTYKTLAAGYPHSLHIVTNGPVSDQQVETLFATVPHAVFHHDNSGWDIGAYQHACREIPCDLMVFFGNSTYIKGRDWLARMVAAHTKHGLGLYGTMGNRGDHRFNVAAHIRTTGFWLTPSLFNRYPQTVTHQSQRYGFEHGPDCLTSWIVRLGLPVFVTTWSGEYGIGQWDAIPNGYHHGDQSDLLVGDRMTRPPFYPIP